MSDLSNVGKSVGIQQQPIIQRRQPTGDLGLDSIQGSKPLEKSKLCDSLDLVGSSKDSVGLSSISRVRSDSPPLKPKVSPFSADKSAVKTTEKDQADITPDKAWAQKIHKFATGAKKSLAFPGHHETKMKALATSFKTAATTKTQEAGGGKDVRAYMLAKELKSQLHKGASLLPTGASTLSAGAQKIRQTHMVLQSLLAQAGKQDSPVTAEDVLRAVSLLLPDDRQAVMRADALTGGDLYNLVYTAQKGDDTLKPMFNELKVDAASAQVSLALDKHDPSGKATQVFTGFINHLAEQGYPKALQEDFRTHLDFQIRLGDVPMPDTSKAGWQQDFSAQLISRCCALESATPQDRAQLLDLPKADLLLTVAHALGKTDNTNMQALMRREGDVHILRTVRDNPERFGATLGDSDKAVFQRLLPRLERNALDPQVFVQELRAGKSLADIETTLKADLSQRVDRNFQRLQNYRADNKAEGTRAAIYKVQKQLEKSLKEGKLDVQKQQQVKDTIADIRRLDRELGADSSRYSTEELNAALKKLGVDPNTVSLRDGGDKRLDARIKTHQQKLKNLQGPNDAAARKQEQAALDELLATKQLLQSTDKAKITFLMERFGNDVFSDIFPNMVTNSDVTGQISLQLKAMDDPSILKDGLQDLVPVLPTAGKPLESFHWVDSTVSDMVDMAKTIRQKDKQFSLADHPIIILDQSDGDGKNPGKVGLWQKNDGYLKALEQKHQDVGLKIVHVSMQQINAMIQNSGLEKLFDTTGQNFAGYGGARNMAFLLTPVIAKTLKEGGSLDDITPDKLQQAIKNAALGTDAPNLFMGDDTDYIRPGGMYAKAGLNKLYGDEYYIATSRRDGRDTMGVSSLNAKLEYRDNLDQLSGVSKATNTFGNSKWNTKQGQPGMGSVTGGPRFCFDIPTGAEEGHVKTPTTHVDFLARVSHLSGDRMKSVADNIRGYLNYSLGTEMFKSLGDSDEQSPWNTLRRKSEFSSLGDVYSEAAKPKVIRQGQVGMLADLAKYLSSPPSEGPRGVTQERVTLIDRYLQQHRDVPPEDRDTLLSAKATYQNLIRQNGHIETFGQSVLKALVPDYQTLSAENLKTALDQALNKDSGAARQAVNAAKQDLARQNIDLRQSDNQVLRDFVLIMDSRVGGGFGDLAAKLVA